MERTSRIGLIAILWALCSPQVLQPQGASPQTGTSSEQNGAIVPAGQKFIMRLETELHSRTTKKGDRVDFKTAAEIMADNQPVIDSGVLIRGTVTKSKRAGRLFGNAEITLKLDEALMPDGTALPLRATITRIGFDPLNPKKEGDSEIKGESGAGADAGEIVKAGAQGAIIGVLSAGPRGAMYGSAAAAAATAIGMILRRGADIDLPQSTMMEARFDAPLKIPPGLLARKSQPPQIAETESKEVETVPSDGLAAEDASLAENKRAEAPVLRRRRAPDAGETAGSSASDTDNSAPKETSPEAAATGADFSVRVQMVLVDAVVRDSGGRMINNLARNDFKVYEDGVLQDVQSFSYDELPLAIALVVDRSGSVAPFISELRRIATRALQQLKPEDQVALFSFAGNVDRIENLTTDRRRIADSIALIQAGGSTNISDALFAAASYLGKAAPERRHAIILVSDNNATVNPRAGAGEVIREALETDTVVYSIKTQGAADPLSINLPSLIFGSGDVDKIAQETGGEVLKASRVSSLDAALGSVISRLRMRYSLGYYPPSISQRGAFHAIEVRLDERHGKPGSDYFVKARRGYYSTSKHIQ